jgi:alkylation response protein AidB-like acyl-CoA dehydrogenase
MTTDTDGFSPRCRALLEVAESLATQTFEPCANHNDQADSPPAENIRLLAKAGLLGLTTPERYGGHGANGAVLRAYTEILASACGLTTFVQGQHLSAAMLIATGENEPLKEELLPRFARGEVLCGVAFSHLRRPGTPVLRVRQEGGEYLFEGTAPWFTGWGLMEQVVVAGTLPDGKFLYVAAPLTVGESLQVSAPMRLCAMNASGTVALHYRGFRVPADRTIKIITREQMAVNDLSAILGVTPQPFGVTRASIRLLRSLANARSQPVISLTADALEQELASVRREVCAWLDRSGEEGYKPAALRARARAIELGVRAAHAAVAAAGGSANHRDQTAQRLFREAMFYTLTAQTRDVQTATLERLTEQSLRAAGEA